MRDIRIMGPIRLGLALGLAAVAAAGCSSTIHTESNVGGVDTLSIDAKQRLMLVGDRVAPGKDGYFEQTRVACNEPSPDALVAQAAIFSARANVSNISGGAGEGSGAVEGKSAETAAPIGLRNRTIQMLRDGYFRLCEAYLNGALTREQYEEMIANADTFMAVVSALETIGPPDQSAPVTKEAVDAAVNKYQASRNKARDSAATAETDSDALEKLKSKLAPVKIEFASKERAADRADRIAEQAQTAADVAKERSDRNPNDQNLKKIAEDAQTAATAAKTKAAETQTAATDAKKRLDAAQTAVDEAKTRANNAIAVAQTDRDQAETGRQEANRLIAAKDAPAVKAAMVGKVVRSYLGYRQRLDEATRRRLANAQRSGTAPRGY